MNLINPNDLGKNNISERLGKIDIDELIREYNKNAKRYFLESRLSALDREIKLTTTKTRFEGKRFWFVCPSCGRRIRIVYFSPLDGQMGCIRCLRVKYGKSRYGGMTELGGIHNY